MNTGSDIWRHLGDPQRPGGSLRDVVFLCRHGETALNAAARLRGLSDPDLDAVGRQQAETLAITLRPTRPRAILASPLRRAVHTAEAIATTCELTLQQCDDLLDRDYGPQNGRLVDEVTARWGSVDQAPGVEPWPSVLARGRAALDEVTDLAVNGPVVLVSHDAVNSALLASLDPERWPEPSAVAQPTGCLNILKRGDSRWTVLIAGLQPSPPQSP
jgi:broad specificity phosphatase PhoE